MRPHKEFQRCSAIRVTTFPSWILIGGRILRDYPGIDSSSATTGLNFTNQSIHTLNSASYPHNPSTNPNIHHDPFNFVEYGEPPQYEPAELDSSNESAWLAQPQRSQGSDPIWPSPHPPINDTNSQDWPEEKPSRYGCTSEFNTSGMFENVESVHEELPKSGAYKPQVGIHLPAVCVYRHLPILISLIP